MTDSVNHEEDIVIEFECPHCHETYPSGELHLCLDDQDADLDHIEDYEESSHD